MRLKFNDHGGGPVGQHPAEEMRVHAGADAVVAALPQAAARQLRGHHRGPRVVTQLDLAHSGIQGGEAGRAHARGRQQLHRPAAEPAVHHRCESRYENIAHGRRAGEHPQVGRPYAAVVQRRGEGLDGQLLIELCGFTVLVEGVVPLPDSVRCQHLATNPLGDPVIAAESRDDAVVVDRIAR